VSIAVLNKNSTADPSRTMGSLYQSRKSSIVRR